ncbi:MAG: membrane-bound lytic murein transglycosylase F [Alcanivorax sp.]|jgi:membrane-bound lytic murein transglycosylase F
MTKRTYKRFLLCLAAMLAGLQGCSSKDSLERIKAEGELVVVTRSSPTTYFLSNSAPGGFEYDLASLLAEDLGVKLIMEPAFSLDEIFTRLRRSEADFAAAGLTLTGPRQSEFLDAAPYLTLTPQVVYRTGKKRPRNINDMIGRKLVVLTGSSHASALSALREASHPELAFKEVEEADSMALLELVDSNTAQLAIIDSNEFSVQQSLYPRLKVAFDLGSEQKLVWYLAKEEKNNTLRAYINEFIARLNTDGTLARLEALHFGNSGNVSRIGSHTFTLNMRKILPTHIDMIKQVAVEFQLEWPLLAAIAYQESHWDPIATSPTGVRGMMMLTVPTAREMGVDDRLDALQSLRGGARYLKAMKRRLPKDIYEPDRTYLALAAYNIGMGHLEDARVLTQRHGGDPHLWRDIMEHLPLLQKSKYYQQLRYGYARGLEAVTYVQNIRHYNNILHWQELPEQQLRPPAKLQIYLPEILKNSRMSAL